MAEVQRLVLHQAQIGPMANFVYLIGDPVTRKAAVVDPAWDVDAIIKLARARRATKSSKILITHYHPDHLGGSMMGQTIEGAARDARAGEGQGLRQQGGGRGHDARSRALATPTWSRSTPATRSRWAISTIKFLHTPGHTPGSQCFLVDGNLISGDTLFVNSCGRVDLPGSDPEAMYYSLNHTLRNLDDATVVYPGHAYSSESSTTIGDAEAAQHVHALSQSRRFSRRDGLRAALNRSVAT